MSATNRYKERIKQFRNSNHLPLRLLYYCMKPVAMLIRFINDAPYRSMVLTQLKTGKHYHQRSVFTMRDRYPLLFTEAAKYLSAIDTPSILSFGCATGEEVATLGQYIPGAMITGVDINEWCIRQCIKKYAAKRFLFYQSGAPEFTASAQYDAIFCMAVFQHTANRLRRHNTIAEGFTFEQYEQEVAMLDTKLKVGGLLVIDNADFSFTDTLSAAKYSPLDFEKNRIERLRPLFGRNNEKIDEVQNGYRVFVKNR